MVVLYHNMYYSIVGANTTITSHYFQSQMIMYNSPKVVKYYQNHSSDIVPDIGIGRGYLLDSHTPSYATSNTGNHCDNNHHSAAKAGLCYYSNWPIRSICYECLQPTTAASDPYLMESILIHYKSQVIVKCYIEYNLLS